MRSREVNTARGLASAITSLSVETVVAEYEAQKVCAPHRHPTRTYLQSTHTGRPRSGSASLRVEEHLMLALYGSGHNTLTTPSGRGLRIIDYQVPLKAQRSDPIGKIDGLGLTDSGSLCLIELKAPRQRGDSPFRALLESLAYLAVIEANRAALDQEIASVHPGFDPGRRPTVLVVGPRAWWSAWERCAAAGDWKSALARLSAATGQMLDVSITYAALDGHEPAHLELGLNGNAPLLTNWPTLGPVPGLTEFP